MNLRCRGPWLLLLFALAASVLGRGVGAKGGAETQDAGPDPRWAFAPLSHPAPPNVDDQGWSRSDIDRFIFAKLTEKGLHPAPASDRRTLLRRIYFDLIGLPPTPEQTAAFLADASPDAYEKVVDALLASPRYGERWARHWMDIVHFAETHGNDQDRERPNAWPYRDYLVQSFNQDKPFARFIEEQVAADALYPDDTAAVPALGFLAAGPWDESSQQDIRDDTLDKKIAQNLDRDDMVQTTMATFTSTTVGCARCHDHKFDPISQADYYGLQAVFAGVDRAERVYDADPATSRLRKHLQGQKQGLESGVFAAGADPNDAAAQAEAQAWAATQRDPWVVLDPSQYESSGGAELTKLADKSILAGGKRPDVDVYRISAPVAMAGVTAVRVELLTDDSLPQHGPGRQDNGNLHVNEFHLFMAPASAPGQTQPVEIASAHADFDQAGWTIAMSIDGNAQTAWGIYPQVGKSHAGVYELKQPTSNAGASMLTFVFEQTHGTGHLIGRLRLSATAAALTARPETAAMGPELMTLMQKPADDRSPEDRLKLTTAYLKQKTSRQIAELPPPRRVYAAASEFTPINSFKAAPTPRPIFVLKRGDVTQPMAPAKCGALKCVANFSGELTVDRPDQEANRRAALARWLSDPHNVLTYRSIANRVWQYHFGRGIVASANDFGKMGSGPTHPELLDWLANYLIAHNGSLKSLHRLIVTSSVYRQSSAYDAAEAKVDEGNLYLWHVERTRLDAESVRDATLQVSGLLDLRMGGPSAKHYLQKPGPHVTPVLDYASFDPDDPGERRLSIYRFLYRTLPDPFMDALDCPDASQLAPVRNTSMTALQALAMMNDRFVVRYSEHLAERLARESGDQKGQIARLYALCLNRAPTDAEMSELAEYANKNGMANVCRIILNSNEFMFVN